jgi:3-phytase
MMNRISKRTQAWFLACATIGLLNGCAAAPASAPRTEPVVREAFITPASPGEDLDSPTVWRAPDGSVRVYVTAKKAGLVRIYDGQNGAPLGSIGVAGSGPGQLNRPNGIAVIDDWLFVVERDNHRVQVFSLPEGKPLGSFGADTLGKPYGLWIDRTSAGHYRVYVSDDAMPAGTSEETAIKHVALFEVSTTGGLSAAHLKDIGETSGAGRLRVVESVVGDPAHGNLLIADEYMIDGSRLLQYALDGRYLGKVIGQGNYLAQAEGLALYACKDGGGYWIGSDQSKEIQRYVVFDRQSFAYLGAVRSAVARNTDGVWLDQKASARFPAGAFYVAHADEAVAAFDWRDIARPLELRSDCTLQ